MPTNFLAILRDSTGISVRHVIVTRDIQNELQAVFQRQAESFLSFQTQAHVQDGKQQIVTSESERIGFFPIYTLHDNTQVFEVTNYSLDGPILSAAKAPDSVAPLTLDEHTIPKLRAFCASETTRSSTRILFQSFDRRRTLSTGRWTFLQSGDTFSRLDRPGFTLGDNIQAIYENGVLLFRSFAVVSRFVNLVAIFNEASDEKISEVLSHDAIHVADLNEVLKGADTIMRKQFAAVSELGVLDDVRPNAVKTTAAEFDIDIDIGRHEGKLKIEFPTKKKDQKELLTFLTEGYYIGPITGKKYQSNSHRPLKARVGKG